MLWRLKRYLDFKSRGVKVWHPCNIYKSAVIGDNVSVGRFTEIGNYVKIGNDVRIGAMCFIPEGVTIEDGAWIGPKCTFTNDRYPPSPRGAWEVTVIRKGARLGANVTVLCGVEIGEGSLIGAGTVVTRNIDNYSILLGSTARTLKSLIKEVGQ
jgi:UDP-2-acetamido-3-amino-2,3-dideoxy-glucuronate N-acetyltransferase